jgi:hypothetical protein
MDGMEEKSCKPIQFNLITLLGIVTLAAPIIAVWRLLPRELLAALLFVVAFTAVAQVILNAAARLIGGPK